MEHAIAAEYLTIHYRVRGVSIHVGVALYVAPTDSLYIMFRDDLSFADPNDFAFLVETSKTFHTIVDKQGAKATFDWMSDTLSNAVYVEGPTTIHTSDPEKTVRDLCECNSPSPPASGTFDH